MDIMTNAEAYLENIKNNIVIDYNNPNCIDCNDCCTLGASITTKEYKKLMKYLTTDINGKVIYKEAFQIIKEHWDQGTVFMKCPFSSIMSRKCRIYHLRPAICKDFHCKPSLNKSVNPEDDSIYEYTLMHLFFNLPKHSEIPTDFKKIGDNNE